MDTSQTTREEACQILHGYLEDSIHSIVILGKELSDHPADRQLQQAMTRAIVDLDRLARAHTLVCASARPPCSCRSGATAPPGLPRP